jgi:uncharacterized protein (TIGR00290 family)
MKQTVFHWSGGKDSALALYEIMNRGEEKVSCLFTTLSQAQRRITMHGVREELLDLQARSLQVPLHKLFLPEQTNMDTYNRLLQVEMQRIQLQGTTEAAFGDIHLEDLKQYRERLFQAMGFTVKFPIWKQNTRKLVDRFIQLGFKALVVCVQADLLDERLVGVPLDEEFLNSLPAAVDPCGENGEFHTFVYDGPIFSFPVPVQTGEIIHRTYPGPSESAPIGFWFCDLVLQH